MIPMIRRGAVASMLALAVSAPAFAQTPDAPDPMCDTLLRAIGAADDQIPFIVFVPADQSLGDLPRLKRNPPGFQEFDSCQIYRAGNATQGTVGGGPHNYLRCIAFSEMTNESNPQAGPAARTAATAAYEKLSARTRSCIEPAGWTATGGERSRKYEDYETVLTFTREGTTNDIVVRFEEDSSSPGSRSKSIFWRVDLIVRNPNPNHPKPQ